MSYHNFQVEGFTYSFYEDRFYKEPINNIFETSEEISEDEYLQALEELLS